jgi:hypothetical protein
MGNRILYSTRRIQKAVTRHSIFARIPAVGIARPEEAHPFFFLKGLGLKGFEKDTPQTLQKSVSNAGSTVEERRFSAA